MQAGVVAQRWPGLSRLIEALRLQTQGLPLPRDCQCVTDVSGLRPHYRAEREGEERVANLDELINAAAVFISEDENSLVAFLAHATLEAGEHQAGAGEAAIQLMTVHAAKGLEFHAVFLCGLEEGLFPHDNSLNDVNGLEEERRLMYVAITRARQRLYLTLAQSRMLHGQTRFGVASRFMAEIRLNCLNTSTRGYAPSSPAVQKKVHTPDHGLAIGMNVEGIQVWAWRGYR